MALNRKGLAGCLQGAKGIEQESIDAWLQRSKELQAEGMSVLEADRTVLNEIKGDIDSELVALKKQLGLPAQTKEELTEKEATIRQKEIDKITKDYDAQISGVDTAVEAIDSELAELPIPKGRPQFIDSKTGRDLGLSAIKNVAFTSSWVGRLLPQRVENGEVKPAQIIVPWKFKDHNGNKIKIEDYIGDNGKIDHSKLPLELLRLMGYRIPTSKQSSQTFVEIVGFLPETIAETIIAPRDLVAQMGLDFDYDKLYLHAFNVGIEKGTRKMMKYVGEDRKKELQNDIIQVQQEVFSDPAVQKVITDPIGYGNLVELSDELDAETSASFTPLSPTYQREKYLSARSSKQGVGVFSLLTTFLAGTQTIDKPVYFMTSPNGVKATIQFGKQRSTDISNPKGSNGNVKSGTASAFQNVLLDNESLQIGDKLGINQETFPVITALVSMGFDENTIIPFIRQPIIKEYVQLVTRLRGDLESNVSFPENLAAMTIAKAWESENWGDETKDELRALKAEADNIGGEKLMEMTKELQPNKKLQVELLRKFLEIYQHGKNLRKLSAAINVDSRGIPKFLTTSLLKEEEIKTVDQIAIANTEALIGDYIRQNKNLREIIPQTISGFAIVNGLFTNNKLWKNIFPYGSRVVRQIYKQLEKQTGMGKQEHAVRGAWRYEVFKDLITYIQSTDMAEGVRERLFLDSDNNKSLATILHGIKKQGMLSGNPFIRALTARIDKREGKASLIEFNNSVAGNTLDENLHAGFSELLDDDTPLNVGKDERKNNEGISNLLSLKEDNTTGYAARTKKNASADSTIALAVDFSSAGERLTKRSVLQQGKKYIAVNANNLEITEQRVTNIVNELNRVKARSLNIAGNGIYTMKGKYTQQQVDNFTYNLLKEVLNSPNLNNRITSIRTGGQTGFDEAGAKAGIRLGIPTLILAPKNWVFRNERGTDISDEKGFKDRFRGLVGVNTQIEIRLPPVGGYTVSKFAEDLAMYGMIAGNHVASSFRRYIPLTYQMQALDTIAENTNFNDPESINEKNFIVQQIQHNPWSMPELNPEEMHIQKDKLITTSDRIKIKQEYREKYMNTTSHDPELLEFLSYRGNEGYHLYALTDRNEGEYMKIPVLGTFGMDEYNPNTKLQASILADRNENTSTQAHLMVANDLYDEVPQKEFIGQEDDLTVTNLTPMNIAESYMSGVNNAGDLLKKIAMTSKRPYYKMLANRFRSFKVAKEGEVVSINDIPVKMFDSLPYTTADGEAREALGFWRGNEREIHLSRELFSAKSKGLIEQVILHEIAHALTVDAINSDVGLQNDIRNLIILSKQELKKKGFKRYDKLEGDRGVHEFVAEMLTDPEFQKILNNLEYPKNLAGDKEYKNFLQAFFDMIVKGIENFLGLSVNENSLLSRGLKDVMNIVNIQQQINNDFAQEQINGAEDVDLTFAAAASEENGQYDVVLEDRKIRIKQLQEQINKIQGVPGSIKIIEEKKKRIEEYESDIEEVANAESLEDLEGYARRDIETLKEILSQDRVTTGDYYEAKRISDLWKKSIDLLFTEAEQEFRTEIRKRFDEYKADVTFYDSQLAGIAKSLMEERMREEGVDKKIDDVLKETKDVSRTHALYLDIGRFGNAMLDVVHKVILDSGSQHRSEVTKFEKELNGVLKRAKKKLNALGYKGDRLWDLFKQKAGDMLTGKLVHRYTPEFFDTKRRVWYRAKEGGEWSDFYSWMGENTIIFDFRKLFVLEDYFEGDDLKANKTNVHFDKGNKKIQAHKDELIEQLGESEFNRLLERQRQKVEEYKEKYENAKLVIESEFQEPGTRTKELRTWIEEHSPYWYAENVEFRKKVTTVTNRGYEFVYEIAKGQKWYDENFKTIANNKELLDFYEMYLDTMYQSKEKLPDHAIEHMSFNAVPYLKKSLWDVFSSKGMQAGFEAVQDKVLSMASSPDSHASYTNIDPVTKREVLGIQASLPSDYNEVKKLVDLQKTKYELEHGKQLENDSPEVRKMRNDAYDAVAREKSFDLEQAIKMIYMIGSNYDHKARIEDQVRLASTIMDNAVESQRDSDGKEAVSQKGKEVPKSDKEAFKNQRDALDFTMRTFFGLKTTETGNVGKVLTKEAKVKKKTLDELLIDNDKALDKGTITADRHAEIKSDLEDQIKGLASQVKGTQLIKMLMKYVQLKGMGWNWFSAFNNIGFGVIANYTTAADGRWYTEKQMNQAYGLTLHSILKNNTLGGIATPTAKKIRAMIEKFGLESIVIEFMNNSETKGTGYFKRLMPFELQKNSEYLNYAPVMIAVMLNEKIGDGNVWENYDNEGKWIGEGKEPDLGSKIIRLIKMNHGNYNPDSTIMSDKTLGGKAITQFRRWALEAISNRFESYKFDNILDTAIKGRYRSGAFGFVWKGAKTKEGVPEMTLFKKNMFSLQQLAKKTLGMGTDFDSRFTQEDAANLRKNMLEAQFYMSVLAFVAMLKFASTGEDDDKTKFVFYTLINSFGRLQMDMSFYVNPLEAERLMRRPIPVSSLVVDLAQWGEAFRRYMINDDIILSGKNTGDSRIIRETSQLLPFGSQWYRTIGAGETIYK